MIFEDEEISILIEALRAWETKDMAQEIVCDVAETIFANDKRDPDFVAKFKAERAKERKKREFERSLRQEQSIMLQSKLFCLRRQAQAEKAT